MASGTIWLDSDISTLQGKIEWSSYSNGSNANSSTVTATLYIARTDGYTTTGTFGFGFQVGDTTYYDSWYGSISGNWVALKTLTVIVGHANNGSGSCYISGYANGPSGTSMSGHSCSGGQTVTLDSIPRYANFTSHSVNSTGLNTITVKWSADSNCDSVQYKLNNGAWTNASSTTYTISNLTPNTQYSIKTRIRRQDSGLWTESGTITGKTKDIGKITSAPDFIFGDNILVSITNPSGESMNFKIQHNNTDIVNQNISAGQNTIMLTQAQLDNLYKKYTNSNSLSLSYVLTTKNTYTYSAIVTCTLTGNAKTFRLCTGGSIKRCKVFVKHNGIIKKGVVFVKYNNAIKRGV